MLESFETGRNFDFQMERNTNQLARGAFLLFKTPSFWTYDNETPRHTLDDFLQGRSAQGRGGRKMNEDALFTARLIRTAMGHLGVSQSELAKYLKSRGRISELLTGKRCPSKAEIAILRELLGLSANILIPRVHLEEACPKN